MLRKFKTNVTLISVCGHCDVDNSSDYIDLTVIDKKGKERILRWPFYTHAYDLAFRIQTGKQMRVKGTKNKKVPYYDLSDFIFEERWKD